MSAIIPNLAFLLNKPQAFLLGLGIDHAATTAKVLTESLAQDFLLEDLTLYSDQLGLVTDIRLAGQSVFCSDLACDLSAFHPEAVVEGQRSFGVPLSQSLAVQVSATLIAAGALSGSLGVQPIPPEGKPFPDVASLGKRLNLFFGLGSSTFAAAAINTITAKALRDCTLGRLVMSTSANQANLTVNDIRISRKNMLGGMTPAPVSLMSLGPFATDVDGLVLAQQVHPGDVVEIDVENHTAVAAVVRGAIFTMPD
jgi:hypothetical protein